MTGHELLQRADEVRQQSGLDAWESLMRVLLSELEKYSLGADLEPLLAIARRHWIEASGTPAELLHAEEACWHLIENAGGHGLISPEGRKARALLCVLGSGGDREVQSMTAEWFVDVLRGVPEDASEHPDTED